MFFLGLILLSCGSTNLPGTPNDWVDGPLPMPVGWEVFCLGEIIMVCPGFNLGKSTLCRVALDVTVRPGAFFGFLNFRPSMSHAYDSSYLSGLVFFFGTKGVSLTFGILCLLIGILRLPESNSSRRTVPFLAFHCCICCAVMPEACLSS